MMMMMMYVYLYIFIIYILNITNVSFHLRIHVNSFSVQCVAERKKRIIFLFSRNIPQGSIVSLFLDPLHYGTIEMLPLQ